VCIGISPSCSLLFLELRVGVLILEQPIVSSDILLSYFSVSLLHVGLSDCFMLPCSAWMLCPLPLTLF
jgi:hypothetical protein